MVIVGGEFRLDFFEEGLVGELGGAAEGVFSAVLEIISGLFDGL